MEKYFGNGLEQGIWPLLNSANSVLLAGCGGYYDVLNTLPLYFTLAAKGKAVHLASMNTGELKNVEGEVILQEKNPARSIVCMKVTSDTNFPNKGIFFPEYFLSKWFKDEASQEVPVYTFKRRGVTKVAEGYSELVRRLGVDLIVLVDGGSDSLMAGDEHDLGTPLEDMVNVFAVAKTGVRSVLCCLGIGCDRFYGVSDRATFRAIAELTQAGGFLGSFCLQERMPEVQGYLSALEYVESNLPYPSIVGHYITSSIKGYFGNYNKHERTQDSVIFVNPIMSQLYFFELKEVVRRVKYRDYVEDTQTSADFMVGIQYFRNNFAIQEVEEWPKVNEF